mmetsp:Transcript_5557/g.15742  ORF Transcript_5557/g.15742 Transcript_5557/m.15742 type:complete len:477 (+) Transcript_5557:138-1568(+)
MVVAEVLSNIVKQWHELLFYSSFAFTLINTFGAGTRWVTRTIRLVAFIMILLFPLLRKFVHYITSESILHRIIYGPNKRNALDLYLVPPEHKDSKDDLVPVYVYIGGGGWTVGYRTWALIIGKVFASHGVLLVSVDYRNFPQGTVSNMLTDVNQAITWVFENIDQYQGDPRNVHIFGQSAGAHLVALAAIDQAARETYQLTRAQGMTKVLSSSDLPAQAVEAAHGQAAADAGLSTPPRHASRSHPPHHPGRSQARVAPGTTLTPTLSPTPGREVGKRLSSSEPVVQESTSTTAKNALERSLMLSKSKHPTTWKLRDIRSLVLLSGPYNVSALIPHLHERGLYEQVMYCIMEGELSHNSPYARVQRRSFRECRAGNLLPPIYLFHGKVDETIPFQESINFKEVLEECGADVTLKLYRDRNHTDAVFEDVLSGDNPMLRDTINVVKHGQEGLAIKEEANTAGEVPSWRLVMARYVNPF